MVNHGRTYGSAQFIDLYGPTTRLHRQKSTPDMHRSVGPAEEKLVFCRTNKTCKAGVFVLRRPGIITRSASVVLPDSLSDIEPPHGRFGQNITARRATWPCSATAYPAVFGANGAHTGGLDVANPPVRFYEEGGGAIPDSRPHMQPLRGFFGKKLLDTKQAKYVGEAHFGMASKIRVTGHITMHRT